MATHQNTCSAEGCNRNALARGLCNLHYRRLKRGAEINAAPRLFGRICSFEGCEAKAYGNGLCSRHYTRVRRHGTTEIDGTGKGEARTFLLSVAQSQQTDCVFWPFHKNHVGHGRVRWNGKPTAAHRVVCELSHGAAPIDQPHVAHSCGNGHLGCVNPMHLRWASPKENAADKIVHGTAPRGLKNAHSILTEDQVRAIRISLSEGFAATEIAKRYQVTSSAILAIKRRRTWAWLD